MTSNSKLYEKLEDRVWRNIHNKIGLEARISAEIQIGHGIGDTDLSGQVDVMNWPEIFDEEMRKAK